MGIFFSTNRTIISEEEYYSDDSWDSMDNTVDAIETEGEAACAVAARQFQVKDVCFIESNLDFYEKVSLIYLLYDDAQEALETIQQLKDDSMKSILLRFNFHYPNHNLHYKLVEALTIIQNFYVLKMFRYMKNDLIEQYLPSNKNMSLYVNNLKKALYCIFDNFSLAESIKFLSIIKKDFEYEKRIFKTFSDNCMEMYLLYWESINYITGSNVDKLVKALKVMEHENFCDCLNKIMSRKQKEANQFRNLVGSHVQNEFSFQKKLLFDENAAASNSDSNKSPVVLYQDNVASRSFLEPNLYAIDAEKPGVCLIVNQTYFYKEHDEKYAYLLPNFEKKLEDRIGTEKDRDNLIATFRKFNFEVILREDLIHVKILEEIESAAKLAANYSSFFVCLLSHGMEGVIYGVNSIPVQVGNICDIMSKVKKKPKVLILQSCQGTICQDVEKEELNELEMDGPNNSVIRNKDMMIFWATVPGYGAIRHKKNGSWFIQSLCEKMLEDPKKYHFDEICVLVQQDVTNKKWNREGRDVGMVPFKQSTFSKFLYLPVK